MSFGLAIQCYDRFAGTGLLIEVIGSRQGKNEFLGQVILISFYFYRNEASFCSVPSLTFFANAAVTVPRRVILINPLDGRC